MTPLRILALLVSLSGAVLSDTFENLAKTAAEARQGNDIPRAIEVYRSAVALNPRWPEGWWFLGTLLYDGDQYAAARDAFQQFVILQAQSAPAWSFLGLCEFETGDYPKALADIEHGFALGAAKETQLAPVLLYHEALLLTREGQFDAALQKYSELLRGMQSGTLHESMLISIGLASLRTPELPNQLEASQKPLYLAGGAAAAFVLAGDYAHAEQAFADLLAKFPNAPNVHYVHGVYLMARDPDEAFREFTRELVIAPDNQAAAAMLALGLLTRGDAEEALPYAEKAAASPRSSPFATYLYGRALTETGRVQRGFPYLQQAEQADPGNPDVHVAVAAAYARAGRPADARRERELAMQMESRDSLVAQP